ncbi:UNKNOWN [Stylonychia lemnae]|uniref:Uncharacterized protein n=1 Tax=Stylonychia lemnae TaxID=5949 RepID=A0A078A978_STYLE|nr:UNKNOWN [Stylonychia lemnae]|eukprot:CDW78825.1 UNKNOWN [Stylonychia lemnae]
MNAVHILQSKMMQMFLFITVLFTYINAQNDFLFAKRQLAKPEEGRALQETGDIVPSDDEVLNSEEDEQIPTPAPPMNRLRPL